MSAADSCHRRSQDDRQRSAPALSSAASPFFLCAFFSPHARSPHIGRREKGHLDASKAFDRVNRGANFFKKVRRAERRSSHNSNTDGCLRPV